MRLPSGESRGSFHGDNGAAIGAFHQTGWTGLIGDLILRRHGAVDHSETSCVT